MGSPQRIQTAEGHNDRRSASGYAYSQALLDAIKAHIAVIDRQGKILAVNRAWVAFARANGADDLNSTGIGVNYLDVCRSASGPFAEAHRP